MGNDLKYDSGNVDQISQALYDLGYHTAQVKNEADTDDIGLLQHGVNNLGCAEASAILNNHGIVVQELGGYQVQFDNLGQRVRLTKEVYGRAEELIAQAAVAITAGIAFLFAGAAGVMAVLDLDARRHKEKECEDALNDAMETISIGLQEFETAVAILVTGALAAAEGVKKAMGDEYLRPLAGNEIVDHRDKELKKYSINRGFNDIDVVALEVQNPDIARKGVKLGFNDEYWDPTKQEQCTYYAALRRTQMGNPLPPGAWGNGGSWDDSAQNVGMEVSRIPTHGAVFSSGAGNYGHVGVVERIYRDGSIKISESNYDLKGGYNIRVVKASEYASWSFIE
ncbi:hypothetical protein FACS1894125_6220 [Actinomycetota bacterium]|nr:hypothetical protein FACS1894125_6220 [Actinomycetota bacterium]